MDHLGKLDSMGNLVPRGILGTKVLEVHKEHGFVNTRSVIDTMWRQYCEIFIQCQLRVLQCSIMIFVIKDIITKGIE